MKLNTIGVYLGLVLGCSLGVSTPAVASFLQMPDTTQVPEMERDSLLKDLDIPSVRERDPDPMAGPRLNITEFRVQGVVEYPELGITRASLSELVESIRFDLMGEGAMLESGYTLDEVGEISDLIAELEARSDQPSVGPDEIERLVFLIREQRQRRGVTVGMVEAVADTITRYYRERGFILAKAYIPEQRVRDGIVTLTLLLGDLGEIEVHNNNRYRDSTIKGIFNPVIGKPVKADLIEERLFFVNDMPGLSAQAYFEPGSQVGDTRLNINVMEERRFNGNVRLDNHGSTNTGEYRAYVDGYWHNPVGIGDQLHIGFLSTFEPSDSQYGSIHYGVPLFSPRAKFTFGGSTNDFVSNTLEGISLTGKSRVMDATLNYIITRSRVKNYSAELRFAEIKTVIDTREQDEEFLSEDGLPVIDLDSTVRNLDLVFNFDVLHERFRALHQGGFRVTVSEFGDDGLGQRDAHEDNPVLFAFNYSLLKFVPVPFTSANSRVLVKSAGQYTDDGALPSTSKFTLTGPNRMRGFGINEYNSDTGFYLGVDWMFSAPAFLDIGVGSERLTDMLQPYVFADASYGDSKSETSTVADTWAHMSNVGFGLKVNYGHSWRAGISYARAVSFTRDLGPVQFLGGGGRQGLSDLDDKEQIYFDLQYSF